MHLNCFILFLSHPIKNKKQKKTMEAECVKEHFLKIAQPSSQFFDN